MIEVKNKKTLTANDFQKFEDDALKFDYSIFVSLNTPTDFKIKDNLIYIHGQYVNSQTFSVLKQFLQKPITEEQKDEFFKQQVMSYKKW